MFQCDQLPGLRKDLSQRRQIITNMTEEHKTRQQENSNLQVAVDKLGKELAERNTTISMLRREVSYLGADADGVVVIKVEPGH